ncbi:hypothetical protein Trydic_g21199 [Trypoxylus dichotomus]
MDGEVYATLEVINHPTSMRKTPPQLYQKNIVYFLHHSKQTPLKVDDLRSPSERKNLIEHVRCIIRHRRNHVTVRVPIQIIVREIQVRSKKKRRAQRSLHSASYSAASYTVIRTILRGQNSGLTAANWSEIQEEDSRRCKGQEKCLFSRLFPRPMR